MTAWRPRREDRVPLALISALPLLIALPQLLGFFLSDPMIYVGGFALDHVQGILPGVPYIDPNNGFQTQALGAHSAWLWLHGQVPWWNYYSGVGLPLAAEYQPGSFFPLIFLLLLPKGPVLLQATLQVIAGLGTYALLRQLGLTRLAALTGGCLYALNGTTAWLAHGPATAVPFLPWMLLGLERAFVHAGARLAGGWKLFAGAMTMSLLAAFPETAYVNGLLALAWAIVRGVQLPGALRASFAARIAAGGMTGIAIAAPQIFSFFEFLRHAEIGGHGTDFAHAALHPYGIVPSLVAPYFTGPIFAYGGSEWMFWHVWGGIGGYVTLALVVGGAYGFFAMRGPLRWLLLGWLVLVLPRTFGVSGFAEIWNLVPGVSMMAFTRYAPPTWQMAFVILAAFGIDSLARGEGVRKRGLIAAGMALILLGGIALAIAVQAWPHLQVRNATRNWAIGSLMVAFAAGALVWMLLRRATVPAGARAVAMALVAEAALMVFIPTMSAPSRGRPDLEAVRFLREVVGLHRFYALGPIQPNYSAYFRVASINHNYLPVSRRWTDWVQANLDKKADDVVFNGLRHGGESSQPEELRRNLANYEWLGVRFVVMPAQMDALNDVEGVRQVYADPIIRIVELPAPSPYFESLSGHCSAAAPDRARATVTCSAPDRLVRRELFQEGWTARIDGHEVPIVEHRSLFQEIAVPAGTSEVRFGYAPPYASWAWLAMAAGLVSLLSPVAMAARRNRRIRRASTMSN